MIASFTLPTIFSLLFSFSSGRSWGWQLTQSGWGMLHSLSNVAGFFMSLNVPYPGQTALFVSCVEFFGSIFLGLGLLSRITAPILTDNMFVAYVTADREALLSVFSDPDKLYVAAPYTFLIASVIVLLFGPGRFALDALLRWLVMTAEEFFTYDVSKSGQRFLINGNAERTDPHPLDIVLN